MCVCDALLHSLGAKHALAMTFTFQIMRHRDRSSLEVASWLPRVLAVPGLNAFPRESSDKLKTNGFNFSLAYFLLQDTGDVA